MSNAEHPPIGHDQELLEAFRQFHFLDQAFPVSDDAELSRAQGFELSVVASGVSPEVIASHRQEGLMLSINDYIAYLDGGVRALTFDPSFLAHVTERIHQARLMQAPHN